MGPQRTHDTVWDRGRESAVRQRKHTLHRRDVTYVIRSDPIRSWHCSAWEAAGRDCCSSACPHFSRVLAVLKPVDKEDREAVAPKDQKAVVAVAGRVAVLVLVVPTPPAAPLVDPLHLAWPVSIWCRRRCGAPLLRPLLSSFGTDDHLHRSPIYTTKLV
jgi:hypothetical protein